MEGAEKKKGGIYPKEVLTQFALDHYDIRSYKEEILKDRPYMDSDRAYKQALDQARKEAARYLDQFTGLKSVCLLNGNGMQMAVRMVTGRPSSVTREMEKTIIMSIPFLSRMVNM